MLKILLVNSKKNIGVNNMKKFLYIFILILIASCAAPKKCCAQDKIVKIPQSELDAFFLAGKILDSSNSNVSTPNSLRTVACIFPSMASSSSLSDSSKVKSKFLSLPLTKAHLKETLAESVLVIS